MQVELSAETEAFARFLVERGQCSTVEEAIHLAVRHLAEANAGWLAYVRASIREGEEDVAAGRLVDGNEVMARLRSRARRTAA